MNSLSIGISICLHMLLEDDSFSIVERQPNGTRNVLAVVTRADFEAVANGKQLEDVVCDNAVMDELAIQLSERCKN